MFLQLFSLLDDTPKFLIICESISILINLRTIFLINQKSLGDLVYMQRARWAILLIVLGTLAENFAWLTSNLELYLHFNHQITVLIVRIAWILLILHYQCFTIFLELIDLAKLKSLLIFNRLHSLLALSLILGLSWMIIFRANTRPDLEFQIFQFVSNIYWPVMVLSALFFILISIIQRQAPLVVKKIIYHFTVGLIGPTILIDAIHIYQPTGLLALLGNCYAAIGFSAIFSAVVALMEVKKILKLDSQMIQGAGVEDYL